MNRHRTDPSTLDQVGVGTVLDSGAVVRLGRPLEKAKLPLRHDRVIRPAGPRDLLVQELGLLPDTVAAAVDAVTRHQDDIVGEVAIEICFQIPLAREPEMIVEDLTGGSGARHSLTWAREDNGR